MKHLEVHKNTMHILDSKQQTYFKHTIVYVTYIPINIHKEKKMLYYMKASEK